MTQARGISMSLPRGAAVAFAREAVAAELADHPADTLTFAAVAFVSYSAVAEIATEASGR